MSKVKHTASTVDPTYHSKQAPPNSSRVQGVNIATQQAIFRTQLQALLPKNMTNKVMLNEVNPKLNDVYDKMTEDYHEYAERLINDQTKTEGAKLLMAVKWANKAIETYSKMINVEKLESGNQLEGLNTTITEYKSFKGSQDIQILQNYSMLISNEGLSFSQVMDMADASPDIVRTINSIPTSRYKFNLDTDNKRQDMINTKLSKLALGDKFPKLEQVAKNINALESTDSMLAKALEKNYSTEQSIQGGIVK